jgi:hypothetical protein
VKKRCDECGRFASRLFVVWGPIQSSGPDHEACGRCRPDLCERENVMWLRAVNDE